MRIDAVRQTPEWLDALRGSSAAEAGPKPQSADTETQPRGERVQALFEANNRALMRFLTGRLKSAQEAKEVAQEAYVKLLQLESTSGISHLQAFLFKIAANLASNRLKSAQRRERIDNLKFFTHPQLAPSPEEEVAVEQQVEALMAAIEQLPAKCRFAFVMHRLQGRELGEVAADMKISERMVRIYVERAEAFCHERLTLTEGPR
jgi:RNA polymerase sigma-70 factor (ECF subfamily)